MMDAFREFVVILCSLFIVITLVEAVLPEGKMTSVIRWVVLIFVLITLVKSVEAVDVDMLLLGFEAEDELFEMGGDEVLAQSITVIEEEILRSLSVAEIQFDGVEAELTQDDTGLYVSSVKFVGVAEGDRLRVEEITYVVLGSEVEVIYE